MPTAVATAPDTSDYTKLKVAWTTPASISSGTIDTYEVEICKHNDDCSSSDGNYNAHATCLKAEQTGTPTATSAAMSCTVPISVFKASPYNTAGTWLITERIKARVRTKNT